MDEITIVEKGNDLAGAVVWWEMSGAVSHVAMRQALDDQGLVMAGPNPPTLLTALHRAALKSLPGTTSLLRPLARGSWEAFVEERTTDMAGRERVELKSICLGRVRRDQTTNEVSFVLEPTGHGGAEFKDQVLALLPRCRAELETEDVSSWLLNLAAGPLVQSVGLRLRGGFYFVPRHRLNFWHAIVSAMRVCSQHNFMELPAMRTEECAAAVMQAVRREAEQAFAEMEAYLAVQEGVSTKGLNSIMEKVDQIATKLQGYVDILQIDLSDLTEKTTQLSGAVAAARIMKEAERAV